ncbi:hypothetical protein LSCM1_07982 [Leishmania martiniquensis]|uniref:Uncharacterized protein n=1 Tax=Leishmania martiniquensis TaxID=1580590 RepID=A0A836L2V3_9TRYP|nr:hypothetical protein LSCM1_07982 [Leishmania martiniquensis]
MLSSSSSSSLCGWRLPHREPPPPSQPPVKLLGTDYCTSLVERSHEAPPPPQKAAYAPARDSRAAAVALPAQEQWQQLQCDREHLPRQWMPARSTPATVERGNDDGGVDDLPSSVPSAANMPAWWWCREGSMTPHDDVDGTFQSTASSSATAQRRAPPRHVAQVEARGEAECLADLRRRVAAQVERRGHGRPAAPCSASAASTATFSLLSTSSSCGCPTSCTCRSETPDDAAFAVSVDVDRGARRASRVRPAGRPRMANTATRRAAQTGYKAEASQDTKHFSDASSETGTTPVQQSSDEESDDLCSSCRYRHRDCGRAALEWCYAQQSDAQSLRKLPSEGSTEDGSGGGEGASLCSLCQAAARAPVADRRGSAASYARQDDSFGQAVREDGLLAEVPFLLHLSTPGISGTAKQRNANGAATMVQRESTAHRLAYLNSAAALAGDADGERRGVCDGATARMRELDRSNGSTQTDAVAPVGATANPSAQQCGPHSEEADVRLRGITDARYAELAVLLLQKELASFEARTALQQQVCFDAVASKMQGYYEEVRQQAQELIDRQWQHQQLLEQQRAARQEGAEAARRAAARVDRATSPVQNALVVQAADSAPQAALPALLPQRAVGTQHSDGTLELLTTVRTAAASWMAQLLLSLEAERRNAVAQDEAECRSQLLHVEVTCQNQLLRGQAQLLYWQKKCAAVRHETSFVSDVHALDLRERLARQQLCEEAALAQRDLIGAFERQRCQAAEAAARSRVKLLETEVVNVESKLAHAEAEHAEALEHVKQLRLQLIYALRMPTVTLVDHSSMSAAARGTGAGAAYGDMVGVQGGAHQGSADALPSAHAASSTGAGIDEGPFDLPVHRRFARAHQEALRVTRAQCRTV